MSRLTSSSAQTRPTGRALRPTTGNGKPETRPSRDKHAPTRTFPVGATLCRDGFIFRSDQIKRLGSPAYNRKLQTGNCKTQNPTLRVTSTLLQKRSP